MYGLCKRKAVAFITATALLFTGVLCSCTAPANTDSGNVVPTAKTEEEKVVGIMEIMFKHFLSHPEELPPA